MKKNYIYAFGGLVTLIAVFLFPNIIQGQTSARTQYFQPGYNQRNILNPALMPQWGYVSIPVAGRIYAEIGSNLGLSNFLFPLDNGELATFMNPEVSPQQFLSKIPKKSNLEINLDVSVLSFGWFWGRSFWSVDVGLHAEGGMNIPYEFFNFAKNEMYANPSEYHIKDLNANLHAYATMSLGYARKINENWNVGARLKYVGGLANVNFNVKRMDIFMSADKWKINTDAQMQLLGRGLEFGKDSSGSINSVKLNASDLRIAGHGAAIDLGAEFSPNVVQGLRFSLAVTDLGFIYYPKKNIYQGEASGKVEFNGFNNIGLDNNFNSQVESLKDDLMDIVSLQEVVANSGICRMMNANLNAGIEYSFYYNKFSVGLLSTTVFRKTNIKTELTVSLNIHPLEWLSLSASYSFLNTAKTIGWALNITPKWGLNLFLASDYTPLVMSPQGIPISKAHVNVQVGLSIPIGNNRLSQFPGQASSKSKSKAKSLLKGVNISAEE